MWNHNFFLGGENFSLQGDGFFVSYNPDPDAADTDEGETAIVCDEGYLILNGDFRSSYENLVPQGLDACKRFYQQQAAYANSRWTRVKKEV